MSSKIPKAHRNKTPEQIKELQQSERERMREQRSVRYRMRAAIHNLEFNNKNYVVVKKILGPMAESTYRRWLKQKHSVSLKKDFTLIQPRHGRRYFEIGCSSVYRQNLYPKLEELESALKDLYPPDEGWHHTAKYLMSKPGTPAQKLHTDYQEGRKCVIFSGMELESIVLIFNKENKKLEKFNYSRGDVVIIKRDTIHAGWYNNAETDHYRVFIDVGVLPLGQAGYKNLKFFSIDDLKRSDEAPENVTEGLGPDEMLGPLLD